ncbi:MAG: PIG-L deacetylase family protein [Desulfomonilaceae bacterium]
MDTSVLNYHDREQRFMFIFAHPDDDVFISGLMKMLITKGVEVAGVWLTSGGYLGGQDRRENELTRAMDTLGLPPSSRRLFRLPDLGLIRSMDKGISMLTEVLRDFRPQNIFVTAFEGGHPDHDAANFIVYESRFRSKTGHQLFEFPLYNGSGPIWTWRWRINSFPAGGEPTVFQKLSDPEIDCKHKIMKLYSSQWMYMIPARFASSRQKLRKRGEPFRRCPDDRDHTVRPHSGRLNYERWFNSFMNIKFKDYADNVNKNRSFI